jgi:hypothetical protein
MLRRAQTPRREGFRVFIGRAIIEAPSIEAALAILRKAAVQWLSLCIGQADKLVSVEQFRDRKRAG